jgi:tetratricopeptide (TPR) repeat protein
MPSSSAAEIARAPQAAPKLVVSTAGDSASPAALQRLADALQSLKAHAVLPLLNNAVAEVRADRHQQAAELAIKALEIDERCALGWHILAISREKAGDFTSSLKCYESALELSPEEPEIANDLGRLAYVMGMKDIAEQLFARYLLSQPGSIDGSNNLACAQRDQLRFGEAVETLRPVIYANPESALLWNTLATVLSEQGEMEQALTFFDEALRLDPDFAKARYNRGNVRLALGDPRGGLEDCEAAMPDVVLESELSMMRLARSTMLTAAGDLGEGWDAYEERLSPHFADVTHFLNDRPMWSPSDDLRGKRLLVIGEQGLGDEVMFANLLPDVLEALGPDGHLSVAVEHRLIPLFRRSFPQATVDRHDTYKVDHHVVRIVKWADKPDEPIDLWTPIASLLRRFRRSVDTFPNRPSYLQADPQRVEHWRRTLAEINGLPKVGLVWKSMHVNSGRARYFSPFEQWRTVLKTPGVQFVNLQYGECQAELEQAREELGVEIWNPPGIDLKDDLDDVAALCCALNLSIGPANATTNLGAACGGAVWLISTPGAWPRLGSDHYPWYPQVRTFTPPAYNRWAPVMREVAGALTSAF